MNKIEINFLGYKVEEIWGSEWKLHKKLLKDIRKIKK